MEAARDCHTQSRGSSPNPVTRAQCKLDKQLSENIVEPENNLKVFIPRTVHDGGKKPAICVVNASDNCVTMKKGRTIASAEEISKVTLDTAVNVTPDKMVKVTPVSPVIKVGPTIEANLVTASKSGLASAQEISKVTLDTAVKVPPDKMVNVTPVSPLIKGGPTVEVNLVTASKLGRPYPMVTPDSVVPVKPINTVGVTPVSPVTPKGPILTVKMGTQNMPGLHTSCRVTPDKGQRPNKGNWKGVTPGSDQVVAHQPVPPPGLVHTNNSSQYNSTGTPNRVAKVTHVEVVRVTPMLDEVVSHKTNVGVNTSKANQPSSNTGGVMPALANRVEPDNFCVVKLGNASLVTPEVIECKNISGGPTSLLSPNVTDTVKCCDSKEATCDEAVPLVPSLYRQKSSANQFFLNGLGVKPAITSQVTPVRDEKVMGDANISKTDSHNRARLGRIDAVKPYNPKLVRSYNARPVTPAATEYKIYVVDKVKSKPLFRNSFKQFTNEANAFKQLMKGSNMNKPALQDVSGQVIYLDGTGRNTFVRDIFTLSVPSDCPTENTYFEISKSRKFQQVTPGKLILVTPSALNLVLYISSVIPDVADIVIPKDSISVACDQDSCHSALTHKSIQESLRMLNIPSEHVVFMRNIAEQLLIEHQLPHWKERKRLIPTCFASEEMAHVRMLAALCVQTDISSHTVGMGNRVGESVNGYALDSHSHSL